MRIMIVHFDGAAGTLYEGEHFTYLLFINITHSFLAFVSTLSSYM
jgi:hypothetical protein